MSKLLRFALLFIILTVFDIITTTYAIVNRLGSEGNGIMALVTSNLLLFTVVKVFGVVWIIGMYRWISEKSEKLASIGQTAILCIMLVVVGNNMFVISANAIVFSSFTGTSGTISNGNGYFSDELLQFNISVNKNIYLVSEPSAIILVEPVGYALGTSSAPHIMQKGDNNIKYGVIASDGYLYYVDGTGIKKKVNRDTGFNPYANDTGIGGSSVLIAASAAINSIYEFDQKIYYVDGTTLKHFSLNDLIIVVDFIGITFPLSAGSAIIVYSDNGALTLLTTFKEPYPSSAFDVYKSNSTNKNVVVYTYTLISNGGASMERSDLVFTNSYIYIRYTGFTNPIYMTYEGTLYRNFSLKTYQPGYVVQNNFIGNSVSIGGYNTIGMYADSTTTYNVLNFLEPGLLHVFSPPSTLTYTTKTVDSIYATYYNNSKIELLYNVTYSIPKSPDSATIYTDNTQRINIISPSGINAGSYDITKNCVSDYGFYFSGFDLRVGTSYTCSMSGHVIFSTVTGWENGTYTAKLVELPSTAVLDSATYTILNKSGTIATSISSQPINSGSNAISVNQIDNWTSLLGLGTSPISKLLFALIIITVVGLIAMRAAGGMVAALAMFAPYIFFTYIEYIPKWIFIVVIIMLAIVSRVFR